MTRFIRATANNLGIGKVIIRVNERGHPYGPLMLCSSLPNEITRTGNVICSIFTKNGFMKSKNIPLRELASVIDHRMKRKLKDEERWQH